MYEIDPLLRLSWLLAAAAPSTSPPAAGGAVVSAQPAPPPATLVERATVACEAPHSTFESIFGRNDAALVSAPDAPVIPSHPALLDRFFIGIGAGYMSSNTEARLNGSLGLGTNVDFEDALGLEETDWVPQGLARWRFSERWRLELEYFELNRSNSAQLGDDITWGDEFFPAGTVVEAKFDISVLRLSCGYSFYKTQDKELGVALGFHLTDIEASIEDPASGEDEGKLLAPLPVVSIYGQFALTDHWAVSGRLDAFKLEYDPYHGRVFSMGIDALYQPWRHWGMGLGWRSLNISGGADGSDWEGDITTNYTGPIVFIATSF